MLHILTAFMMFAGTLASAIAHETWMMPSKFAIKPGEEVRVDVSSGMAFPRLESAIELGRVKLAGFRLGGSLISFSQPLTAEKSLLLRQQFPKAGLATGWLELKPREIELPDKLVAEYLDEIDASENIRARWARMKGTVPWREIYTKHAKTFIAVGDARTDKSWSRALGATLEIVPLSSPLAIAAGKDFTVELLFKGKPYPDLPVGFIVEGSPTHVFRKTNADGKATFPMTSAGRAIFFVVRLQFDDSTNTWASDFSTMTVEVRPP